MYRLLDLDNCISNDQHRIPLIDWQLPHGNARYERYHAAGILDAFANADLVHSVAKGEKIVIMTGRPVKFVVNTVNWLRQHRVKHEYLLMRNNDDERRSALVKEQQLNWLLGHYDIDLKEITSAFDDHPEVIEMYLRRGIPATQVSIHSVSAYINPLTMEPCP